ncbi:MAG: alkaline phosphatase family protein [Nevskiaceae bacterium]
MKRTTIALLAPCLLACAQSTPPAPAAAEPAPPAAPGPHVVIVTIDGLRPDAITEADTPALARLLREGASSRAALVPEPWLTLPSHFSMVTGQTPARHGIRSNKTRAQEPANATLFTAAHDAGLRTALYFGKRKLLALAPRASADVTLGPGPGDSNWHDGSSESLAARFAADFPRERFALALVHLREPDEAGHDAGWMTPAYRDALAQADRGLAVVLTAIAQSGLPTTVFLTSDHGGADKDHWTHGAVDWTVPWICVGPGVKAGAAIADAGIVDVGPTAAAVLGVTLPAVEGKVVKECLAN